MISDHLELALITYNRAGALELTLEALAASPFAACRLTILDNCSTDSTPEVCARFEDRFPDVRIVRHKRNVGGEANYLRAVEGFELPYGWVVCDDDDLDFSQCDDVIAAIEEGHVDVLSVGAPGREDWPGGTTTMGALARRTSTVYGIFVFMPNTIYRTAAIDTAALKDGYDNIQNLYPMFAFVRRLVERDAPVHVSQSMLVHRRGVTVPKTRMYWFVRWVRCVMTLEDPDVRREIIWGTTPTKLDYVKTFWASILQEKLYRPEAVAEELWELLFTLRGAQRALLVLFAPFALIPRSVLAAGKQRITGEEDPLSFRDAAPAELRD